MNVQEQDVEVTRGGQVGRLPSDDWRFPFANLVGSSLIMASLLVEWNLPSVVIEVFWIAISLYGTVRHARAYCRNRSARKRM